MYVTEVRREDWIWRGLAIATILAIVGMVVVPAFQSLDLYFEYKYGHGPNVLTYLELAHEGAIACIVGYYSVIYATTLAATVAGIVAAGIIILPALIA